MQAQTKQTPPTEDEKKRAFEMRAELKIYQLYQLAEVINLASTRSAFRGAELSHVGALFDNLSLGVDKAFKIAREQIASEASEATKPLEPVPEEPVPEEPEETVVEEESKTVNMD